MLTVYIFVKKQPYEIIFFNITEPHWIQLVLLTFPRWHHYSHKGYGGYMCILICNNKKITEYDVFCVSAV